MLLNIAQEVRDALAANRAVVALESSVVAQGLPPPDNLRAAQACEAAVRKTGAVPATIAVIDGVVRVGISETELERLASGEKGLRKLGSRDLPMALAQRATGGTTVSATTELAAQAGIRVFATGGIGGVHRGVAHDLDVSQDLWAISRFPVAIVCAGAKSVLDLPKTMEALETLAVPVVGVGTDELPSFFSQRSGLPLEHRVEDANEAARVVRLRFELKQGGIVFAQPPPAGTALSSADVDTAIDEALKTAQEAGIRGKAITPYLLSHLAQRTGGLTLGANVALLEHNATFAGQLAVALESESRSQ